ncbi:MAG TPA: condensation domain-containing protein, partial [Ktedonobacteraceae bacterium]|nr:condensation domain-containing protein [Ktedonobacteraceae bacterium]
MNPRDASEGSGSLSSTDLELLQHFVEDAQALFNAPRGIGRRASGMTAPLSFAQKRLWFLAQLEPDKPIYNVRLMARLRGTLHLGAFHASFQEVVRRHEILRTTFEVDGYEPVQIIQPSVHIHFPLIDLSGLSSQEQQIYLHKLIREETQHAFDLTRGPLFKGLLLQIGSQEHIFFLKLHHIITDGWSRGVLLQELGALYEAFIAGKPSPLPELPIQYADFAAWQRQQFQENYLSSELEYWRQQLADAPPLLELPLDRPRPPVQRYAGATLTVPFSPSLTSALNALSRREGVTLFMTLLAAFQALLARFCGQEDIPVGAFIANRLHKELEGLIGFFVNILVLRTNLSGNPSFRELLQRVRQTALAAYAHQDLPFEKLVEELHPERNLSYHPLIQVMFQLDNTPLPSFQVAQLSLEPVEFEKETSPFDLSLLLSETKQGLHAFVEY